MTQNDRDLLRSTFNQDAERYDRARPGYPAGLFDDLAELTSIGPGSRVLEIGPGTGQATRPLAERGCRVVAVELGADLAALARRNLAGGDESFFAEVQDCYVRFDPDTPSALTLKPATDIPSAHYGLDQSSRFGPATLRRYEWDRRYTTAGYIDLLLTYSGHRALDPEAQRNLLDCIAHLIDTGYGGQITRRYLTELRVAATVDPASTAAGS